jgi:hypothetical protein
MLGSQDGMLLSFGPEPQFKKSTEQMKELNAQIEELETRISHIRYQKLSSGLTVAGAAAVTLGTALKAIGNKSENENLERLGNTLSIMGAASVGLGQLAAILPKIAT